MQYSGIGSRFMIGSRHSGDIQQGVTTLLRWTKEAFTEEETTELHFEGCLVGRKWGE